MCMEEDEGLKKLMWLKTMMIVITTWMVEGSKMSEIVTVGFFKTHKIRERE